MAIDFAAMIRGQRAAAQDNRFDEERMRREEEFNFRRQQREIAMQQQDWERDAAAYTAPLLGNMQQAADAGQSDLDFLINQRNVVMQDPAFQAFSPEVQSLVLKRLGEAAQLTAQQYVNAGDSSAAKRLYQAYSWGGQIPDSEIAFQSGDVNAIVQSLDKTGTLLEAVGDGTYRYKPTGVIMRGDELAAIAAQGGGAQALPALSNSIFQREQAATQQTNMQLMLINAQRAAAGLPPLTAAEAGLAAPATAQPAGAPAAAPTAGAPAAPAPTPTPTALTGATPTVAQSLEPVAPALLAQAGKLQANLPAIETAVNTLTTRRNEILAELDRIAPVSEQPGFSAQDSMPRRVPTSLENARRMGQLESALTKVTAELDENRAQLKLTGNQGLGAVAAELSAATAERGATAAWGAPLLLEVAGRLASPEAATQAVKESPEMVKAYIEGLASRLQELARTPSAANEAEAAKLMTARANLQAALAARAAVRPVPRGAGGGGGR